MRLIKNFACIGFGYTAQHLFPLLSGDQVSVWATYRRKERITPSLKVTYVPYSLQGLQQLAESCTHCLISTPPTAEGGDPTLALLNDRPLLKQDGPIKPWIGLLSSTRVYGDHKGAWVNEAATCRVTRGSRGYARLHQEQQWHAYAARHGYTLVVFRLAAIYGPTRNNLHRLLQGKQDTIVAANHVSRIHVTDIVNIISLATKLANNHVINLSDDEPTPSYLVDEFANKLLDRPPLIRLSLDQVDRTRRIALLPFYSQSKRVGNALLKTLLDYSLLYPNYRCGLRALNEN